MSKHNTQYVDSFRIPKWSLKIKMSGPYDIFIAFTILRTLSPICKPYRVLFSVVRVQWAPLYLQMLRYSSLYNQNKIQ